VASNDYVFLTTWRVTGNVQDVYDILSDISGYLRWWPEVYLKVEETAKGDENKLGNSARLLTKGELPYTISWQMRVIETDRPNGFTIEATGDFEGRGIWTFTQKGSQVEAVFDWRLRGEKPLFRYFSFIFKPLFRANHRWAMARGEEGLRKELAHQRTSAQQVSK